jgi:hypothetical protein
MQHVLVHHQRPRIRPSSLAVVVAALAVAAGLTALLLATRSSSSSGPVEGSGVAATVVRTVPAFRSFELAGANQVSIHVGGRRSVILRGDHDLLPLVTTQVVGGTLVVSDTRSFTTNAPMSVEVTVPSLRDVRLSGSGSVSVDGLRAARLSAVLRGSGLVAVGGVANRVDATLGGVGRIDLGRLEARDVHALLAGTGEITVIATRSLEASVTGTGDIGYSGNPREITRTVTGTGSITPR